VFTLLKEVGLHVTQSFLQLSNLILSLLQLPRSLVLITHHHHSLCRLNGGEANGTWQKQTCICNKKKYYNAKL